MEICWPWCRHYGSSSSVTGYTLRTSCGCIELVVLISETTSCAAQRDAAEPRGAVQQLECLLGSMQDADGTKTRRPKTANGLIRSQQISDCRECAMYPCGKWTIAEVRRVPA
jgi:hypothetical protein